MMLFIYIIFRYNIGGKFQQPLLSQRDISVILTIFQIFLENIEQHTIQVEKFRPR